MRHHKKIETISEGIAFSLPQVIKHANWTRLNKTKTKLDIFLSILDDLLAR